MTSRKQWKLSVKGQAIAAKRSDREAAEGCVLAKKDGEFAAIIALKCRNGLRG